MGYDVCVVRIFSGYILMVINTYTHQHYDPPVNHTQYDAIGNPIPVKKLDYMNVNEIEGEEEKLITESETTITEVDYGLQPSLSIYVDFFQFISIYKLIFPNKYSSLPSTSSSFPINPLKVVRQINVKTCLCAVAKKFTTSQMRYYI